MALSANQKQLKEAASSKKRDASNLALRLLSSEYDLKRVTELWANLCMVQEMKGNSHWIEKCKSKGLAWKDFVEQISKLKDSRLFVFDDGELIFGFGFLVIEKMPEKNNAKKAIVKELYLEPSYRVKKENETTAEKIKELIKSTGVQYVEFAVEDL